MRITVFGSTGRVGRQLLRQALSRGMEVVAYARHPEKINFTHPALTVVPGELSDTGALVCAVDGSDCVLSVLGPNNRVKPEDTALSSGVENIISVLEKNGPRRFIQVATASIHDPEDKKNLRFALLTSLVRLVFPGAFAELFRIGTAVQSSELDWTLVRVPILSNKPGGSDIRAGYLGQKSLKLILARADLAWFMLQQAQSGGYIKRAPEISS